MATIAQRPHKSIPRRYAGFALTAIIFAAAGSSVGWAIGHQTRNDNRSATTVQSITQPVQPVDVSGLTPPAPDVPADVANSSASGVEVAPAKGGVAESIDAANAANAVAPAKGGFAESIDAANAAGAVDPDIIPAYFNWTPGAATGVQPTAPVAPSRQPVYVYLVGSQEEADAQEAMLSDKFVEAGGASFEVRVTDTPEAQAAAYAQIQLLSGMEGIDLHVVDLRPTPTAAPGAEEPQMDPTVPS